MTLPFEILRSLWRHTDQDKGLSYKENQHPQEEISDEISHTRA